MKYIPSEESEEVNYKHDRSPLFNLVVLLVGAAGAYLILIVTLGLIGEAVGTHIPAKYEGKIFSFMNFKSGQKPWPLGQEIVDDIFSRNQIDGDYKPTVFLSCENTTNAIALPGQKVIVFKGLLKDMTTLNSLYFVLGHEVGHIINRDHLRSIGRALAVSVGLSFLTFTESNSFFSLNQAILDRQFSQNQEGHSDEKAIEFTKKRFNGLAYSHEFFDNVLKEEPNSPKIAGFLSTHPLTQARIDLIKNNPAYLADQTIKEPLDFRKIDCP